MRQCETIMPGITSCRDLIDRHQIKCFWYLLRIKSVQLLIRACNPISSHWASARPRKREDENIKRAINKSGYATTKATHLALECKPRLPTALCLMALSWVCTRKWDITHQRLDKINFNYLNKKIKKKGK